MASNPSESATEVYWGNDEYYNGGLTVQCLCHEECWVVTSCTESNPLRRFDDYKNDVVIFWCK